MKERDLGICRDKDNYSCVRKKDKKIPGSNGDLG